MSSNPCFCSLLRGADLNNFASFFTSFQSNFLNDWYNAIWVSEITVEEYSPIVYTSIALQMKYILGYKGRRGHVDRASGITSSIISSKRFPPICTQSAFSLTLLPRKPKICNGWSFPNPRILKYMIISQKSRYI